jgi:hypothetical protein
MFLAVYILIYLYFVAAPTTHPAPAAGECIGRMTEAPGQSVYQWDRQKQLLLLQELYCVDTDIVTSHVICIIRVNKVL